MSYSQIEAGIVRTTAPPLDVISRPRYRPPPWACDSHFHIFGPAAAYPFDSERTFTPHDVPNARVIALHDTLGIDRGVIVQSACHGHDHAVLLDALRTGQGRFKAVALLQMHAPASEIEMLDAQGVCGARFHLVSQHDGSPDFHGIHALLARTPEHWHAEIHVKGDSLLRHQVQIQQMERRVVIDHMGRIDITKGLQGEAFLALRRLLDRGNVWVKLSGADRMSHRAYPFEDAVAFARILAEQAPERVIWGTDFPHPNPSGPMPDDGRLVDLIPCMAPSEALQDKLLVDNPAELFGFDAYVRTMR